MSRNKNKVITIGTMTQAQIITSERRISREIELEADPHKGFKATHKVHKSDKTYNRKSKHRGGCRY